MMSSNIKMPSQRLSISPVLDQVMGICEPVLESMGFECVHVEMSGGSGRKILRFFIDGPDGVMLGDCTRVSRQLSAVLDVDDPLSGAYRLEVSSPGLDRPLGRLLDFERHVGEEVSLVTAEALDGRRRWKGQLKGVKNQSVMLRVDGNDIEVPFELITKANIHFDYESALQKG
jgi:ribosome maturation factor RimP